MKKSLALTIFIDVSIYSGFCWHMLPHASRVTFLILSSVTLAFAQSPAVKPKDLPQQAAANLPRAQVSEIHTRIEELRARQAEYHKKVASGAITPNADLQKEWPTI